VPETRGIRETPTVTLCQEEVPDMGVSRPYQSPEFRIGWDLEVTGIFRID
jgi:hypothetical protein